MKTKEFGPVVGGVHLHAPLDPPMEITQYFLESLRHVLENYQGRTCSMGRRTKLLVRQYLLPLNTDQPWVVLVKGDLDGPLNQYGQFSQ